MSELSSRPVLLLIDVQQGFDDPYWGKRNNPKAEENIAKLLEVWRAMELPVWHVQHMSLEAQSPLKPGKPGCEIMEFAKPVGDEPVFQKNVNSAFIGTNLETCLRENQFETLVVAGFTSDHCVSTTTRMAGNLGFDTFVVADATATFDRVGYDGTVYDADQVHSVSLASLNNEFATVLTTWDIMQKLAVAVVNSTFKTIDSYNK